MALCVDIEKTLGRFHLRVQFEAENHVLALLGASGCGKSMTLKCIAGIETPDSGRIVLDGVTLFDSARRVNLPPQKRRVGYLFQQYALFPNMTVRQNIACGARGKRDAETRISAMMTAMRLEGLEDKRPHQLSGGQQQRVALARILVGEPDVLLLDEPFSALDSHLRFQMEQEVRSAIHGFGRTVIFVSHNRDEAFRMSDSMAIMDSGRIETIGARQAVFDQPTTRSGALLTGCRNVERLEKVDEHTAYVPAWGVMLRTAQPVGEAQYAGIRGCDLTAVSQGTNTWMMEVAEEMVNPFSVTVMLRPEGKAKAVPLCWELDRMTWQAIRADRVMIHLPPERVLLLRESG